jgi:hypothetical protein
MRVKTDQTGIIIFTSGFILCSLFLVANYIYFLNPTGNSFNLTKDALLYHNLAVRIAESKSISGININYIGYPLLLSLFYSFMTPDFLIGLLLNFYALMFSMVLLNKISLLVFQNEEQKELLANYSMILMIMVPYIVRGGTLLLKDSIILLVVLMVVEKSLEYKYTAFKINSFFTLFFGIVLLGMLRAPYLLFLPFIFISFNGIKRFNNLVFILFALVIINIVFNISMKFSSHEGESLSDVYITSEQRVSAGENSSTVYRLIGNNYQSKSIIDKVSLLPTTTTVQVLLPFPFSGKNIHNKVPPVYMYSVKLNFIWYLVFFLILSYFLFIRDKQDNNILKTLMIIGALFYLVPAFSNGGTTPRYAMPFVAMLLPGAAYVLNLVLHRRSFLIRYASTIFVAMILFIAFFILIKL